MAYQSFEELEVWKRSCRLASDVLKSVAGTREYAVKDQMIRSALSIPSNIAEGSERGYKREFKQFLRYAKGSAAELRTQLYLAKQLKIIENGKSMELISELKEISSMLHGLEKSLTK